MRERRGYNMNIKEVEKVTGLTKANIRFYEEEGLVCPKRNEQNNYRIYTEVEIKRLQEVKKLRLLGISIPEIQKIYAEELSLQKAMERRLKEIREEERLLQETRAICQKAIRANWNLNEIDRLEIKESKEEWQERLRKLMTEDLVQTKLTRNELNNTIGLLFSAGMLISMLTVYFMNVTWIKEYVYWSCSNWSGSCVSDHICDVLRYKSTYGYTVCRGDCTASRTYCGDGICNGTDT